MTNKLTSPFLALIAGFAGSLLIVLMAMGFQAVANPNTDEVPREIPYSGTLDFNGSPVTLTGERAPFLKFELTDGNGEDSAVVYSQIVQTNIYGGQFTAMLGPSGSTGDGASIGIQEVIAQADSVFLKVSILGLDSDDPNDRTLYGYHDPTSPENSADDDIVLGNPQRLLMSPFTLWATNATDFNVSQSLTTAGRLEVGNISEGTGVRFNSDGAIEATHDVAVGGNFQMLGEELRFAGAGTAMSVNYGTDTLALNPGGSFTGGTKVWGDFTTGNITAGGGELTLTKDNPSVNLGIDQSGPHGFVFGDNDGSQGMQMVYRTDLNQLIIEQASNGDARFIVNRGGAVAFPNGFQVNGTLSDIGRLDLTGTELALKGGGTGIEITGAGGATINGNLVVNGIVTVFNDTRDKRQPDTDSDFAATTASGYATLMSDDDGICFLSDVRISHISSDGDASGCEVVRQSGNWKLRSHASSGNAGAYCEATCVTWKSL